MIEHALALLFAERVLSVSVARMLHAVIQWLVDTIGAWGYPGIVLLMALESSCFPFPSEVVMIPAGYLAQQGEMALVPAILAGVAGSVLGALFNYLLAATLGRAVLLRWGKFFFVSPVTFLEAERCLKEHGAIVTFVGRLLPGIRQYISLPAGLARMSLGLFCGLTALGAGIWVTVLALIGYAVGENQALIAQWSKTALFWLLLFCIVLVAGYVKWHLHKHRKLLDRFRE